VFIVSSAVTSLSEGRQKYNNDIMRGLGDGLMKHHLKRALEPAFILVAGRLVLVEDLLPHCSPSWHP
jgi:hypothetical protein